MSKTKRINQKNPADCAVCVLAMFLGHDYDEFILKFPFLVELIQSVDGGGLNTNVIMLIASSMSGRAMCLIHNHYDHDDKRTDDLFDMLKGRPAMVSCISLNYPGVGHAVYWDGEKIYDPSNKKRYTRKTIKPYQVMF